MAGLGKPDLKIQLLREHHKEQVEGSTCTSSAATSPGEERVPTGTSPQILFILSTRSPCTRQTFNTEKTKTTPGMCGSDQSLLPPSVLASRDSSNPFQQQRQLHNRPVERNSCVKPPGSCCSAQYAHALAGHKPQNIFQRGWFVLLSF